MSIKRINTIKDCPTPSGPYSLGVVAEGKFLFVAGQAPYDPEKGTIVRGTVAEQTELVLRNVERIVKAGGASMADVVACKVYLQNLNMDTFKEMNTVYAKFFGEHKPVRTTIGSALLGMDVEIDCIACISKA